MSFRFTLPALAELSADQLSMLVEDLEKRESVGLWANVIEPMLLKARAELTPKTREYRGEPNPDAAQANFYLDVVETLLDPYFGLESAIRRELEKRR